MTNLKQLDAVECDTIYQEKGEFFFRKPGFRDAYGPFASEDEANEAAVRAGVIADSLDQSNLRQSKDMIGRYEKSIEESERRISKLEKGTYDYRDELAFLNRTKRLLDFEKKQIVQLENKLGSVRGDNEDGCYGDAEVDAAPRKVIARAMVAPYAGAGKEPLTLELDQYGHYQVRRPNDNHVLFDSTNEAIARRVFEHNSKKTGASRSDSDGMDPITLMADATFEVVDGHQVIRTLKTREEAERARKTYIAKYAGDKPSRDSVIIRVADAQADDNRTPDQKLAVAKRMYEQDLKSAPGPSERAQVKEDFESFKKAMIKAGARADADDPCWEGYHSEGMKEKDGKAVPNCIPDAAPQPLIAEDRKYWKRECRDRIQDATASIKSYEEDLKRAESKFANLGSDTKPSNKQSLQADVRDYKDLIRQQRMRLKSAQETLEMVDKPNTTSEQIEAIWRKNKYADSAAADAAVSFDKGNPEKPWSVKVGSSIKRFAFRQQAEAAARGDAEVDAITLDFSEIDRMERKGMLTKAEAEAEREKTRKARGGQRGDAEVDAGVSEFGKAIEAAQKAHNLGISRGAFKSQLVGMKASSSEIERYLSAYDNWKSRGDSELDAEPTRNQRFGFGNPNASKDQMFAFLKTCAPVSDEKLAGLLQVSYGVKPAKARSVVSDFKSRADSTPTIVREGDQWIIVVKNGAEKSVFRLGVREYPTEAEALEYATTNPQYTNNKPTSALDSLMAACDSLYAKADEIERRVEQLPDRK